MGQGRFGLDAAQGGDRFLDLAGLDLGLGHAQRGQGRIGAFLAGQQRAGLVGGAVLQLLDRCGIGRMRLVLLLRLSQAK